ncbi:MAG: GNAT family N-acetyltransferase [Brachybacterium sp.]
MTATEVHLRPADPADAAGVGAMHFASFVETYSELAAPDFWDRATAERSIENWRRMLDAGIPAMLAEAEGAVVGLAVVSVAVTRDEIEPVRDRELTNLYVLAQHQGSGIGRALLEAVLPAGAPAQLWVAQGNPQAVRFYERHGFAADGATVDGSGFGGIAALRMAR